MPRFAMDGLQPLIEEMTRMGEASGDGAEAALLAGAEEVKRAWKESAESHEHRDTGDMIESIDYAREPSNIGGALTIDIYPQGRDSRGIRNAEKAFILNYGTSKLEGSGWVFDADAICEKTVVPAMEEAWDAFLENGGRVSTGSGITTRRS